MTAKLYAKEVQLVNQPAEGDELSKALEKLLSQYCEKKYQNGRVCVLKDGEKKVKIHLTSLT